MLSSDEGDRPLEVAALAALGVSDAVGKLEAAETGVVEANRTPGAL